MVATILKIVITLNTICDNLVGFPKSGHILHQYLLYRLYFFNYVNQAYHHYCAEYY